MSVKGICVVLSALVCGASAVVTVTRLRGNQDSGAAVLPETSPVVVVVTTIPRGRMITAKDVCIRQWPPELVPAGAIAGVEDAMGRAAIVPLTIGEPLLDAKLAPLDAGRGLAALVPKGMRAYAIQVSRAASGVAGFILPGNRVDVLLNLRGNQGDSSSDGPSTTVLLQSVEILAVDQQLDAPADNKVNPKDMSSVTLLVTSKQASLLDLGQNLGQLTLSLRNPGDGDHNTADPATLSQILPERKKPAPVVAPPASSPPPPAKSIPEEPQYSQITTLHGSQWGLVVVKGKP
ncbi:MAG: Flp pilus assembly protein CpaB [Thermoguttaceae bacterium]